MQLNTIPLNARQRFLKAGLDRHSILGNCAPCQFNDLVQRLIEIKTALSRRCVLDLIADAVDDPSGSIGIVDNAVKCLPDFAKRTLTFGETSAARPTLVPFFLGSLARRTAESS